MFHSIILPTTLRFLTLFFRSYFSALLVLSTVCLFMKVSFSPDIIPGDWLSSKHQWTTLKKTDAHCEFGHTGLSTSSERTPASLRNPTKRTTAEFADLVLDIQGREQLKSRQFNSVKTVKINKVASAPSPPLPHRLDYIPGVTLVNELCDTTVMSLTVPFPFHPHPPTHTHCTYYTRS